MAGIEKHCAKRMKMKTATFIYLLFRQKFNWIYLGVGCESARVQKKKESRTSVNSNEQFRWNFNKTRDEERVLFDVTWMKDIFGVIKRKGSKSNGARVESEKEIF